MLVSFSTLMEYKFEKHPLHNMVTVTEYWVKIPVSFLIVSFCLSKVLPFALWDLKGYVTAPVEKILSEFCSLFTKFTPDII